MNILEQKLRQAQRIFRNKLRFSLLAFVLILMGVFCTVYFVYSVPFQVHPAAAAKNATVSLAEGTGAVLFGTAYLLGKHAALHFEAPGFLAQTVTVDVRKDTEPLAIVLREAPVQVALTTDPPLAQTRWRVAGAADGSGASFVRQMQPGIYPIEVDHEFYTVQKLSLTLPLGQDIRQHLRLAPLSGSMHISSTPSGAMVLVDGVAKGITPLRIGGLAGGKYRLQVQLEEHQDIDEQIAITNRRSDAQRDYLLQVERNQVRLSLSPAGGVLRVNGLATEIDSPLLLPTGESYIIAYQKPGFVAQSQRLLLEAGAAAELSFALQKEFGEVHINTSPPTNIFVNGKFVGQTPQQLLLQALPQKISLRRPEYRSVQLELTPSAAVPRRIEHKLLTEFMARLGEAQPFLTAAAGIKMKFFDPRRVDGGRFTMGASPDDRHRRANEFQRMVQLRKPFYVSVNEISEAQFAQYRPPQGVAKNTPVRNVSWHDAAGFCNWMSARDGLPPAYQITAGKVRAFDATADGYRLVSEAEWEWLARIAGRKSETRFVWGHTITALAGSGNLADESLRGSAAAYIHHYHDGFTGVAPVGSFAADAAGLHDMAGNVSEWVQDRYDLQPPAAGQVERDPFGSPQGHGHVIKGASFRSASVIYLRSSYREGLSGARADVGFRVARYLYGKGRQRKP